MPDSDPYVKLVRRVGERILNASAEVPREKYKWTFNVIESDMCNAFVLPGGGVVVFTGMIRMCADESQLAAVLGHEVGHCVARHPAERMTGLLLAKLVSFVIGPFVSSSSVFAGFWQLSLLLPASRMQEREADYIGMVLMARAGYCPHAAPALWERMYEMTREQRKYEKELSFLSTHPASADRVTELNKQMAQVMPLFDEAYMRRSPFHSVLQLFGAETTCSVCGR